MNTHPYTDDELAQLKAMPKRATNPGARWQEKPSAAPAHRQRNFQVVTQTDAHFAIYQRENLAAQADFSCGIRYCPLGASPIVLACYNGASHIHGDIVYRPHIHSTTAASILAGRMPESEASEPTATRLLMVRWPVCWRTTMSRESALSAMNQGSFHEH